MEELKSFLARHKAKVLGKKLPDISLLTKKARRRAHVEKPIKLFLLGYQMANESEPEELAARVATLPVIEKRVLYEGAHASFATMDLSKSGNLDLALRLTQTFPETIPTMFMGLGYSLSLLEVSATIAPSDIEQSWGWLALDAYGFAECYFHWTKTVQQQITPVGLTQSGQSAFDEGAGRAIWMMCESDPLKMRAACDLFPIARRPSLWTGIGVTTGFWGATDERDMRQLLKESAENRIFLQQGVAIGVWMKYWASNLVEDFNKDACNLICKASSGPVVDLVDHYFKAIDSKFTDMKSFQTWRHNIYDTFERN